MVHHGVELGREPLSKVPQVARPGLLRQLGNGLGGLIVLLITGVLLVIAVLLKSR
ncbi:hypothetical protein [Devosia sp. FKR38]|uniref:hypothetical protein n=1 Tax=Devosia sp. FKR38 TaxID=2562312 RepID=UPI0014859077|nr:hypothetical protein [Devosia sp. FKR38]